MITGYHRILNLWLPLSLLSEKHRLANIVEVDRCVVNQLFSAHTSGVLMCFIQQSAAADFYVSVCVCNGKNSVCPLAVSALLIQEFRTCVHLWKYIYVPVCLRSACVFSLWGTYGTKHYTAHVVSDVENNQGKEKRKNRWSKRKNIKGNMRNRKLNDRNGRSEEKEKAKSKDEVKSLMSVTPTPQLQHCGRGTCRETQRGKQHKNPADLKWRCINDEKPEGLSARFYQQTSFFIFFHTVQ